MSKSGAANPLEGCTPDTKMIAWLRRRSGPDCDFGEVFEELFGSRHPVSEDRFVKVLKDRGVDFDCKAAFDRVKCYGSATGAVGAQEFEAWQNEIEEREAEGLRGLRDYLKSKFPHPSAAYKELGKGEGDVLTKDEFATCMTRVGFNTENPEELFRCMDKDFSGEISFAEFKSVMKAVGAKKEKKSPRSSPRTKKEGPSPRDEQKKPSPRERSRSTNADNPLRKKSDNADKPPKQRKND